MIRLLLVLALAAGCGPSELDGGTVPARYQFLFDGGISKEDVPKIRASIPFEKIQLAHASGWSFDDPIYTLWSDGHAEGPLGEGQVSVWDYASLCYLIETLRLDSMQPEYSRTVFDGDTSTVSVWTTVGAAPMVVREKGTKGPIELWGIQAAIEGVAGRVEWITPAPAK